MGSIFWFCNNIDDRLDKLLRLRTGAKIVITRLSRAHTRSQGPSSGRCQRGLTDRLGRGLFIRYDSAAKAEVAPREVDIDRCSALERDFRDLTLGNCRDNFSGIHAADRGEFGAGFLE